jgi:chromate transporter
MTGRGWGVAAAVGLILLLLPLAFAPVLAHLNLIMMQVDLLAFGGGYTTIPLLQRAVVDRFGWVSLREFIDGIALGQITPGPISITATFVGYKVGGLIGALFATIAVYFPSFVLLTVLIPHYDRLRESRAIRGMVQAILAAFLGMLLFVAYRFGREALTDGWTLGLAVAAWLALWRKVDLPWVIGGAILFALVMA